MAEIKIEKKKPVWPWVLVAIIVIGLLVYFLADSNTDNTNNDMRETQPVTPTSQLFERNDSVLLTVMDNKSTVTTIPV